MNIERHTTLMRNEVTFKHIKEEYEARAKALSHYDQESEFRASQQFQALKTYASPTLYDERLDWLLNRSCRDSGQWLARDQSFLDWLDMSNQSTRLLWLQGIPGAGRLPMNVSEK